jgi:hypothetical protein
MHPELYMAYEWQSEPQPGPQDGFPMSRLLLRVIPFRKLK